MTSFYCRSWLSRTAGTAAAPFPPSCLSAGVLLGGAAARCRAAAGRRDCRYMRRRHHTAAAQWQDAAAICLVCGYCRNGCSAAHQALPHRHCATALAAAAAAALAAALPEPGPGERAAGRRACKRGCSRYGTATPHRWLGGGTSVPSFHCLDWPSRTAGTAAVLSPPYCPGAAAQLDGAAAGYQVAAGRYACLRTCCKHCTAAAQWWGGAASCLRFGSCRSGSSASLPPPHPQRRSAVYWLGAAVQKRWPRPMLRSWLLLLVVPLPACCCAAWSVPAQPQWWTEVMHMTGQPAYRSG